MKLKRLSLFLALVMIISAFAGTFTFASAEGDVWYIGDTSYATLKAAVSAAQTTLSGDATSVTIQLKGDVNDGDASTSGAFASIKVPAGKKLTIKGVSGKYDGNDSAARLPKVNSNICRYIQTGKNDADAAAGELVIKDLTIEGTGGRAVIQIGAGKSTVTLDNATIINSGDSAANCIVVQGDCTLNVTNGSVVKSTKGNAVNMNENGSVCNVDNAKIEGAGAGVKAVYIHVDATLNVDNFGEIRHTGGSGYLISVEGGNATINMFNSSLYQTFNTSPIWVVSNNATINIKGVLHVKSTSAAHAVIRNDNTVTIPTKINIEDAVIANYFGGSNNETKFTRLVSCYGPVDITVRNSVVGINSSTGNGIFEMQGARPATDAPSAENPNNKIVIENSIVTASTATAIVEVEDPYSQITINNSNLVSAGTGINLTAGATGNVISITDSQIIAKGGAAIVAQSDTAITVGNSGLSTSTANAVSGATPTYTNTYVKTEAGVAAVGGATISGEKADEIAAAVGLPFRVASEATAYNNGAFDGYFATPNTAVSKGLSVTMVGDYISNGNVYTLTNANATAENPVVINMNGYKMVATVYNRIANPTSHITFKDGTLESYASSGVLQLNGSVVLTLDNVVMNSYVRLNNAPIVVTKTETIVNVINGSVINAEMQYDNYIFYSTQADTVVNIVDSTITKTAITQPANFTGGNNNTGMINTTMQVTIANSTIDFSQDYKGRIIYMGDATKAAASSLTLINSNFKASCGSGPISWYNANTIHMYGNNTFTGGDRLVEFAGAGYNSLYAVENDDEDFTPSIDTKDGAGIRTVKGTSGIRFISTISADVVAGLKAAVEAGDILSYSFGTVIMKADDLKGTTVDKAIAAEKKYVDIPTKTGIKENEDGSVNIFAALVNIKSTNLNTEFAGIAYIDITIQNGPDETKLLEPITIRIYSDYNEEHNARSITEVAKKALGDVKTTSSNEIVDGFRYNNELAVGETYYVNGEAKTVQAGEKLYSAYNADQREVIAAYLA